jgi:hypothetical protein
MQTVIQTSRRIRGFFEWSGSELWSCFKYSDLKLKIKNLQRLMSFSRPIQWYHSHADPIRPDGTFKAIALSDHRIKFTFLKTLFFWNKLRYFLCGDAHLCPLRRRESCNPHATPGLQHVADHMTVVAALEPGRPTCWWTWSTASSWPPTTAGVHSPYST